MTDDAATLGATAKASGQAAGLRAALDQAVNVLYGMRNFIRHNANCAFAVSLNLNDRGAACSCRFDEVESAYDAVIEQARAALAAPSSDSPTLDVERLAEVLRFSPMHWEIRRPDGAFVMTRMFDSPEEAAAYIAAAYRQPEQGEPGATEATGVET